jgi:hypothetical protein
LLAGVANPAATFACSYQQLHVLVNNAGASLPSGRSPPKGTKAPLPSTISAIFC